MTNWPFLTAKEARNHQKQCDFERFLAIAAIRRLRKCDGRLKSSVANIIKTMIAKQEKLHARSSINIFSFESDTCDGFGEARHLTTGKAESRSYGARTAIRIGAEGRAGEMGRSAKVV